MVTKGRWDRRGGSQLPALYLRLPRAGTQGTGDQGEEVGRKVHEGWSLVWEQERRTAHMGPALSTEPAPQRTTALHLIGVSQRQMQKLKQRGQPASDREQHPRANQRVLERPLRKGKVVFFFFNF